ncbi:hypothetical protein [Nostoc sp. TCL26-01]|uniref:hypothetical protein n=1 Tax=Nostoc sp. TCL26-01 TaxID=2576904 RepID=UPI0015BF68A1|nr:hypothetical protein [Nostoc sp. TCL26-01]QLE59789.1 hypothetical protein FD725_30600 [Nostoc sp. TCL26-01]
MTLTTTVKPEPTVSSINQLESFEIKRNITDIPKTITVRWWWKQHSWAAYQLPDGIKVMSDRQMALMLGQSKTDVKNFVESNHLETISVQIPSKVIIQGNTLPTIAAYLQHLLKEDKLQQHRLSLSRCEWKELIKALSDNDLHNRKPLVPNPNFFTSNYQVISSQAIQIELENDITLEVLVMPSGEYRIGYEEGLNCIQSNPNWLLENSPKKARTLTKLNLSPCPVKCLVAVSEGFKQIYTLSCDDWLSIWEYFANKGNRRATAILKACAKESIASRVVKLLSGS